LIGLSSRSLTSMGVAGILAASLIGIAVILPAL
jgi:hypothetical protein